MTTGKILLPDGSPLRLSPTRMMDYQECKAKFKTKLLKEEEEESSIHAVSGTAAHYVVEQINKGASWDAATRRDQLYKALIKECSEQDVALQFIDSYKDCKEYLTTYEIPAGWELISAEGKKVLSFARYDFSFITDALFLERSAGIVHVIDYKGGSYVPKSPLQLMLNTWATQHVYPDLREYTFQAAYWMLRTGRTYPHAVGPEEISRTQSFMEDSVELIAEMLELNHWPKKASRQNCKWCPAKSCPERYEADGWG